MFRNFFVWGGIGGSVLSAVSTVLGAASNELVIWANHGKMPVYGTQTCSIFPGFPLDERHICAGPNTHLGLLADWISTGKFIESIGDVLLNFGLASGIVAGIIVIGGLVYLAVKKDHVF